MNRVVIFLMIFLFISGSFVSVFSSVSASALIEDSWNTKTPMKQARTQLGVVAVDGKIYAIGGYTGRESLGNVADTNERYDPKTDTWITLEPMPTARGRFAIAAYENTIYCIGGSGGPVYGSFIVENEAFSVNEVYDIATYSWSTKASFPFPSMNMQAHVVDGKIYVILLRGDLYMYDPATDVWTQKTSMPSPLDRVVVSAVVDGKIAVVYIIGTHEGMETRTKSYDPKTDVWSEKSVPAFSVFKAHEHSMGFLNGGAGVTTGVYAPQRVYALGFMFYLNMSLSNQVYNPVEDTWAFAKDMPTRREHFGVAVIDDILYVIGGSLNEQYVPIGYRSTAYTTPTPSNSAPSEPDTSNSSEPFLNSQMIVAVLVLTVGIVVTSLFLYFNKRRRS